MEHLRHSMMVLGSVDRSGRPWSTDTVLPGPHPDHLLLCGCCEAPLVYGWLPSELTAIVLCECGCCCAVSEAAALAMPGIAHDYVKA